MMRTAGDLETLRIHAHLLNAERFARTGTPKRMPWLKALTRQLLLEELARYRRRLRYPKNYDFPGKRVPHFVDDHGTRCAVAHLLEVGGQAQLVEKVARQRNHARVRELLDEPALVVWLAHAGLTVEEAARIQPTYCVTNASACFCDRSMAHPTTIIEAAIVTPGVRVEYGERIALVRIERIDGAATDVQVGEEREAFTDGAAGQRVLLAPKTGSDAGLVLTNLNIGRFVDDHVICQDNQFTRAHPVHKSIVTEALLAPTSQACEQILTRADPVWAQQRCDDSGCGCSVLGGGALAPELATVAILAAVLGARRRRRS